MEPQLCAGVADGFCSYNSNTNVELVGSLTRDIYCVHSVDCAIECATDHKQMETEIMVKIIV